MTALHKKISKSNNGLPKIGVPASRALAYKGIETLTDLSKYEEAEILNLHGMGLKALGILKTELKAQKLSFKKP